MKLLIRENDNNLTWKDVGYKNGFFFDITNEKCIYDNDRIYAIKDDDRNKIVICSACGKEVRNTSAAMDAHRNMINNPDKCFECHYLRARNGTVTSQKYSLNEDGTYNETTKRVVTLTCGNSWSHPDISQARDICYDARCENATFKSIEDFWTRTPDAFDEFITIDRLLDCGYDNTFKTPNGIVVTIKSTCKLHACVNNQGIVYAFELWYQRRGYTIRYSKRYDKVYVEYAGNFREFNYIGISDSTRESILNKFRKLYK